jgi:spore germination protein
LQKLNSDKGKVKFAGAAVIDGRTKKLRGFLNEKEIEGITWITGKGKGGLVKSFDRKTGQPIIYEVESMKSHIQPHVDRNKISFNVKIESEGRISENLAVSEDVFKNEFIKKAENATEKEVERLMKNVINRTQKDYKVDVAGFGNRLRIKYPKEWKKLKKNWDQTFSKVPIRYTVKISIKDYGTSGLNK